MTIVPQSEIFEAARNAKLRLIETYLLETPDPDRGWALAALTGGLDFPAARPALLRGFGQEKIGEELFALSYDYVGDLAETLALIWATDPAAGPPACLRRQCPGGAAWRRWRTLTG